MRTESRHAGTYARPSPCCIRAASTNRGFFTIGFVVVVLVAGAVGVGIVEAVEPESGSRPGMADLDRLPPVEQGVIDIDAGHPFCAPECDRQKQERSTGA